MASVFHSADSVDLGNYGMWLQRVNVESIGHSVNMTLEFNIPGATVPAAQTEDWEEQIEKFFTDIRILNAVNNNPNVAVKDQWEKLLTVLALVNSDAIKKKDK